MKVDVISTLDGLESIREEWENLWLSQSQPCPYQSWTWVRFWVGVMRLERRLFILAVRHESGKLLGVAPLQRAPLILPWFYVLTFIGQDTSISTDFLARADYERAVCEGVLQFVSGKWNIAGLVLKMAEPLHGAKSFLDEQLIGPYGFATISQYSQRPILHLPTSYDEFLTSLSTKMRQEMRAARKKLQAERDISFSVDDVEKDYKSRLNDLFDLNDLRWGQSGGRGTFEKLYPHLHSAGMLKILTLHIDGRPAAGLSVLVSRDAIYAELAGFNYEISSRHLGKCFYGMVIEWAISNGYKLFDFSSGSEDYKLRFNPQIYPKYRVEVSGTKIKRFLLEKTRLIGRHIRWLREPSIA